MKRLVGALGNGAMKRTRIVFSDDEHVSVERLGPAARLECTRYWVPQHGDALLWVLDATPGRERNRVPSAHLSIFEGRVYLVRSCDTPITSNPKSGLAGLWPASVATSQGRSVSNPPMRTPTAPFCSLNFLKSSSRFPSLGV
jgi:hypothetical protein